MTFEFFAYWNGAQIRELFEAVLAITGSSDYTGLLTTLVLFGFLCVITVCALRYRGLDAGSFIFAVLLFSGVTLLPKTDVAINDETVRLRLYSLPCSLRFSFYGKYTLSRGALAYHHR